MDEKAESHDEIAEQAVHDRSVIDHVVHTFSPGDENHSAPVPTSVHSAAVYRQIRKTWPDQR